MFVDKFVLDLVFNRINGSDGLAVVYWRELADPGEGYLLLYPDGNFHHTYHYPPNINWEIC